MGTVPGRAPAGHIRLSYEDYLELPEDGRRYQILDGELAVTPAPTSTHQGVSSSLMRILAPYIAAKKVGRLFHAPIDVILSSASIVQPDLVFIAAERRDIISERGIEGPPDLVIEILSDSTAALYARFGVQHYWLIDPAGQTLETYEKGKRRGEIWDEVR